MGVQFGLDSDAFGAAAGALDENSVDLSKAIESVYGADAGKAFLDSWRKHIGFFVDYTAGQATGDKDMAARARKNLDGYRQDFGELIEDATEGALSKKAVADALKPHVASTLAAIDAVVGVKKANGFLLLKKAAAHMPHVADALSGAIAGQFPEKFDGDPNSGAADLQQALTAGLVEHEYLAGIAVVQALTNEGNVESPQFQAAAAALDRNSVDLAKAVGSIYGSGAEKAFLDSWRKHIGFFVSYTLGKATGDRATVAQAKADLDGYRQDFGELLEGATEGILPADAVAEALRPHVDSTIKAIDAAVAFTSGKPQGDPFVLLKAAAGHMPHIATAISGAVVEQFPDKF
jgi:DNA-binding transcriptional regulator YdaS (Cro superfamily)